MAIDASEQSFHSQKGEKRLQCAPAPTARNPSHHVLIKAGGIPILWPRRASQEHPCKLKQVEGQFLTNPRLGIAEPRYPIYRVQTCIQLLRKVAARSSIIQTIILHGVRSLQLSELARCGLELDLIVPCVGFQVRRRTLKVRVYHLVAYAIQNVILKAWPVGSASTLVLLRTYSTSVCPPVRPSPPPLRLKLLKENWRPSFLPGCEKWSSDGRERKGKKTRGLKKGHRDHHSPHDPSQLGTIPTRG